MKKRLVSRLSKPKEGTRYLLETWHNGGDTEIYLYARALQNAAKVLVAKLELDRNARTDWDVCPIVLLYRQALEIHLKSLVGEGANFLKNRTDPISLAGTRSLRWLAQIVCQIIKAVGWKDDFTCEGVSTLADFSALVNEIESFDPVTRAIRFSTAEGPNSVSQYYRTFKVLQFANKLDSLLDLLDATADALAATWDQRAERNRGDDFKPVIQ